MAPMSRVPCTVFYARNVPGVDVCAECGFPLAGHEFICTWPAGFPVLQPVVDVCDAYDCEAEGGPVVADGKVRTPVPYCPVHAERFISYTEQVARPA